MGKPAAKKGDRVMAVDTHLIKPPGPPPPVPIPHMFSGIIDGNLSSDVKIEGQPAAFVGSTVTNTPGHVPIGGTFVNTPSDKGTIKKGSETVKINGKAAARSGDKAETCNDPADKTGGTIMASGTVMVG